MLYPTLRSLTGVALRWYYREVTIVGGERIPKSAPVLFVVNHPNALVDALVIGWVVPRSVRITAKAVLFDNPALGIFLRALGIVPLRRASDERQRLRSGSSDQPVRATSDPARNAASFAAILGALDRRSAVLIFPEGKSHDAPGLEPLKTGPARIALAARDEGVAGGLQIVPVGLVFESKEVVRSRVLAVVGDPIDVHAWEAPADAARGAEALTAEIDRRLRAVILSAPSSEQLARLQSLAADAASVLAVDAPPVGEGRALHEEYVIASRIARGFERLDSLPPSVQERAAGTQRRLAGFIRALRAARIDPADSPISLRTRHGARFLVRELLLMLVLTPLAAWGRLSHWVPFRLARHIAMREVTSRDQPAMRTIVAGLALVLASYVTQGVIVWLLAGGWTATAYLLVLPIAADVDLRYTARIRGALRRMRAYLTLRRNPALAESLSRERAALASEIRSLDAELDGRVYQPGGAS